MTNTAEPVASSPSPGTADALVGACDLESFPGEAMQRRIDRGEFDPRGKRVQVLNPRGTPPPIALRPMAARPGTMAGRTIYLVDVRFMNGKALLEEVARVLEERVPGIRTVVRQKRGGYTEDDPELWREIEEQAGLVVMAIGHCSTCAPAVAVHCMHLEDRGIPTAPLVTSAFPDLVRAVARKAGMPGLRFTFVPHPISGKNAGELRRDVEGASPVSGEAVLEGIVRALTSPLTPEESERGRLERPVPRLLGASTEEELHGMFQEAWWTDGLPIVLPTPERVAAMLRGTGRAPDEVIGRMRPTQTQEDWAYTVEQVAVNAVMAGALPEHFPVILALAATGITALHSSTSGFASMVVVNGPIRHEIRMNGGLGALGPFNRANAAIGRAYALLSRNLGGGAVPGVTYLGTQGNPLNYANICFAENEERSPWQPFHMQKGFARERSTVSIFRGRSYSHLLEIRHETWRQQLLHMVGGFTPVPGTGLTLLVEPLAARALKDREGFETQRQLATWFHENATVPYETYWDYQLVVNYIEPLARKGLEPFASYLARGPGSHVPRFADPEKISALVVGGEKNAYWYATDFVLLATVSVDEWR